MEWTLTHIIQTCPKCLASWHAPRDEPHQCAVDAARRETLREVLTAIRYGDLKGPIGEEMLRSHKTVGGMLLTFEEWFAKRFEADL